MTQYLTDYQQTLERFLDGTGEEALSRAYDIGRQVLEDGCGILDLVSMHDEAVRHLVECRKPADPARFVESVGRFLLEALSPFELSHRAVGEANAALRRLNELLEKEAQRIAHALHDQAGSILASAGLELDLAVGALPIRAQEQLKGVRRLLDETGEQLRHLSRELRPTILDDLGLRRALDFLAEGVAQRTGLKVRVRGKFRDRAAPAVETAVYRVVQEAVNNSLLHGGGSPSVTITIEKRLDSLECVVEDDGVGFDLDAKRGLGLLGMRERMSAVGGTCKVDSTPGAGTSVVIRAPLAARALE
jgi:signal transduction histidine kinase